MIHKEVHRLGTHQYNMLFIVCFISRIIPTANKSLPVFLTNNFLSFSFFCFHFSPVFMCVPHEPWPNTSLQFCPFTMCVSGVSNSGHLAWWQVPLISEPLAIPFLSFQWILSVLEVRALNSQATPKKFSVAQRRRNSLQQEYGRTLCSSSDSTHITAMTTSAQLRTYRTRTPSQVIRFH